MKGKENLARIQIVGKKTDGSLLRTNITTACGRVSRGGSKVVYEEREFRRVDGKLDYEYVKTNYDVYTLGDCNVLEPEGLTEINDLSIEVQSGEPLKLSITSLTPEDRIGVEEARMKRLYTDLQRARQEKREQEARVLQAEIDKGSATVGEVRKRLSLAQRTEIFK